MKKILAFMISLVMIVSAVGCMNNNANSLPINSDSSNSSSDTGNELKEDSSGSSLDSEDNESSKNDGSLGEDDDSSSNQNENKPSNESDGWTGFF